MARLAPNSTQIPNAILDEWLPDLRTHSEMAVLLYIARRTFGFQQESTEISLKQISSGHFSKGGHRLDRGTGIGERGVAKALNALIERGMVVRSQQTTEKGGYRRSFYRINLSWPARCEPGFTGLEDAGSGGVDQEPGNGCIQASSEPWFTTGTPHAMNASSEERAGYEPRFRGWDDLMNRGSEGTDVCSEPRFIRRYEPWFIRSSPPLTIPPWKQRERKQQQQQMESVESCAAPGAQDSPVVVAFASLSTSTATALVDELIALGVGKRVAAALVERDAAECRRQLDAFATIAKKPSNPGGWLRRAIEDGFGPPPPSRIRYALLSEAIADVPPTAEELAERRLNEQFEMLPFVVQQQFYGLDDTRRPHNLHGWRKRRWEVELPSRIAAWMKERQDAAKTTCPEAPPSPQAPSSGLGASSSQLSGGEGLHSAPPLRGSADSLKEVCDATES